MVVNAFKRFVVGLLCLVFMFSANASMTFPGAPGEDYVPSNILEQAKFEQYLIAMASYAHAMDFAKHRQELEEQGLMSGYGSPNIDVSPLSMVPHLQPTGAFARDLKVSLTRRLLVPEEVAEYKRLAALSGAFQEDGQLDYEYIP